MFNGWLIKFGNVILPNSFIMADGWESVPNQRVEVAAYRDANVLLHRETSENFKTKLTLTIREPGSPKSGMGEPSERAMATMT